MSPDGTSNPRPESSAPEPHRQQHPDAQPDLVEAMAPSTVDSPITDTITWRPVAPRARSSAQPSRALGDRHAERVVDDERADEQGDHREHEQERLEERQSFVDRLAALVAQLRAGDRFDARREHRGHPVLQHRLRHAVGGAAG